MEYTLELILFSALILILSIIGYRLTRKSYVTPAIIFVLLAFISLFFYQESFFIWVLGFTLLSIIVSIVVSMLDKTKINRKK